MHPACRQSETAVKGEDVALNAAVRLCMVRGNLPARPGVLEASAVEALEYQRRQSERRLRLIYDLGHSRFSYFLFSIPNFVSSLLPSANTLFVSGYYYGCYFFFATFLFDLA